MPTQTYTLGAKPQGHSKTRAVIRAFTLMELLVVIAIIALLAVILFPVFAKARDKARQTACLSNLRQLGLAAQQYAADNDGTFFYNAGAPGSPASFARYTPSVRDDKLARDIGGDKSNRWDPSPLLPVLEPYVKSNALWACPALALPFVGAAGQAEENTRAEITNYQVNAYIAVNSIPDPVPLPLGTPPRPHTGPVTDADIITPTRVKLFQDYYNGTGNVHGGGANYACADGHAKWQAASAANAGVITSKWWTP
jgi:prepilin-type N-terminal cleavage/methylation domain-containing protein/prepilin-type processing-associated H-X9-DG protein